MKRLSRLIALILIAIMTLMPLSNVQAAQKIKISKSSLKLHVGEKRRLTISGTDTVKWKTSDKTVATVSQNGYVKAITEGTAKITGTVNKKNYSCTVTVLPKILSEKEKVQNITYKTYTTDTELIVCLKNNNADTTSEILALDISVNFYNASGELIYISTPTTSYYHVVSGKEFVSVFTLPKENVAPYNKIDYASYKINIKSFGTINYKSDISNKIEVTENVNSYCNYFSVSTSQGKDYYYNITEETYNKLLAQNSNVVKDQRKKLNLIVNNNSEELIDNLKIYVLYFKDGQVIGFDEFRGRQLNIGKSILERQVNYITEMDGEGYGYRSLYESTDKYDDYKMIINYAYVLY